MSSKIPQRAIYTKGEGGEWAFDSALRGKVNLAAVSAGLDPIPVSFSQTITVSVTAVRVNNTISDAVPVKLENRGSNQDVRLAAISSLSTAMPVHGNATIANFIATCLPAVTRLTFGASGTAAVVAAQGASTSTEIRGISLFNESAAQKRLQLRFGNTTPFWGGGLNSKAAYNWNYIGHYQRSAANKKVVLWASAACTITATVYYKKV